jgi:hypothetical protein
MDGSLNGVINFKQNNTKYEPFASLNVTDLSVNNSKLGTVDLDILGNNDLNVFQVRSSLQNKNVESFNLFGNLYFKENSPSFNVDVKFDKFNIGAFSTMGGDVVSDIRGLVNGSVNFKGEIDNPEMNGRLFLNEAGLKIPYLNIDLEMESNAIVDLTQRQFLLRNIAITDTKFKTKGILSGNVKHTRLSDWILDIGVNSNYLAVLDTQDSDEAYYYGKAFISGNATISGPTDALFIKVNAKSEKGTSIKLPILDNQSVGENSFINFVTNDEKYNLLTINNRIEKRYNGLELEFDLDIDKNAEIEVILNKETGHNMKGRGVGSMFMEINTLGKFQMNGDFIVQEGQYNFKYGGLIDKKFKVETNIFRPFNIIGPGMKKSDYRVFPNFFSAIKNNSPLNVFRDGKQTRTFCYIVDAMISMFLIIIKGKNIVYNIGVNEPEITMKELAKKIQYLVPKKIKIRFKKYPKKYPQTEPIRRCPDISRIIKEFKQSYSKLI